MDTCISCQYKCLTVRITHGAWVYPCGDMDISSLERNYPEAAELKVPRPL